MIGFALVSSGDPFTEFLGAILIASGLALAAFAAYDGYTMINLAKQIGNMGGHYQGLTVELEGVSLIGAAATGFLPYMNVVIAGILFAIFLSSGIIMALMTPGGKGTFQTTQSNLQVDDNSMQSTENQINSLQSQINSDQSQIAADQANLAQEEALPQTRETKAQIAQDNAQIAADNTQIGNDQNQISNTLIPNLQQEISQTQSGLPPSYPLRVSPDPP